MSGERSNTRERRRKPKPSVDLNTMMYGKVPPQARELEGAVLGAIMTEKDAFDTVSGFLSPECFYVDAHQRLFKTFIGMKASNIPIDLLTVVEEMKAREELDMIGGPHYISQLTNAVVSAANLAYHAKIVYEKYVSREIIRISGEAISSAYEDGNDPFDLLDSATNSLTSLSISKTVRPYRHIADVAKEAVENIKALRGREHSLTGVPSGIHKLDMITQGWQKTSFIVIAARPAVGKSAVAANLALNAAQNDIRPTGVAVFSLEMSSTQWVQRMLSSETEILKYDLKRGEVTDDDVKVLDSTVRRFRKVPIFFDDTASLDLHQFKSKARQLVLKEGVGLIIVDYLQLLSGNRMQNDNREQEVSRISREFKQLAKELSIPIIALSQLSRQGAGSNPTLSTLRESGAIEQDADEVYFLIEIEEKDQLENPDLRDGLFIDIAKNRDSIRDKIAVRFVKPIQKIMNEDEYQAYMHPAQVQKTISDMSGGRLYIQKGFSGNFDDGVTPVTDF